MSNTPLSPGAGYRTEIDGLRALAVVAVILNHIDDRLLPSGYLGVDVFFVISGFVITASLTRRPARSLGDLLLGFYSRRLKRLVPALLVFVVVVGILSCLVIPRPHTALRTGISALFGFSNIYLHGQATDYFGTATKLNPFTHTWSLGVEEQVYLLLPLVAWLTGFARPGAGGHRALFGVMGVASLASLVAFIQLYPTQQAAAYFLMPPRLWEMGAGCLLFCLGGVWPAAARGLGRLPPLPAVLGLVAVMLLPLAWAVPATVAAVLLTTLLIASLRQGTAAYLLFTRPALVQVGLISYSLYLWHWGVLSLSRWTIGLHWWSLPFQIGLMVLLSVASYRWVEKPLRQASWAPRRDRTIAIGVGGLAAGAGLLIAVDNLPPFSLYAGRNPIPAGMGVESLVDPYRVAGAAGTWQGSPCVLANDGEAAKTIAIEDCTLGDFATARHRVLVVGNSFSASFAGAFDELVARDGYAVTITSAWAASPVGNFAALGGGGPFAATNRAYWNRVVPELVAQLRPGDWVFLVNDMVMFSPPSQGPGSRLILQTLRVGLSDFSADLARRGVRLAVLNGLPFAREANCHPASAVPQWFSPFGGPCLMPGRAESLRRRQPLDRVLGDLQTQGKLEVVDLFDLFCPEGACTYRARGGEILYRDEHSHPSKQAVQLAAPLIRNVLRPRPE
ncbi:acyltransferase [Cyanobium sp. Copco_Reservoir_LC18]|uniref:acyltransferase family protein n=1 Tax=Cyanobium sp. Copco_Reservoir_LC18 TaxID=1328305 RepID=UPI00135B732B|nr:acyltransferase family protein [Cyanobium sp. Copco_Reservoir_LC18]KAF0652722.1 acyltransferase [Cyanobium sp. Copco_Reservoir_LC18]